MFKKLVEELKSLKEEPVENSELEIKRQGYTAFPLSKDKFHQITSFDSGKKICFIDGGNASIIQSPSLSIDFIRVNVSIFQRNKKISSKKEEFFSVVKAKKGKDISFKVKIISNNPILLDESTLSFDLDDKTLRQGMNQVNISTVANAIRRFSEISFASMLIDDLSEGDMIIFDGTLQSKFTNESLYWKKLFEKALNQKVMIASVAKTCSLLTTNGEPITSYLQKLSSQNSWYYHPIVEINDEKHQAEMFFAKLNEQSKHCFRVELFKKQNTVDFSKFFGVLSENSKDISFPGYPFGLIDADRFARITIQEQQLIKTKLLFLVGKSDGIEKGLSSLNAHEILDSNVHG